MPSSRPTVIQTLEPAALAGSVPARTESGGESFSLSDSALTPGPHAPPPDDPPEPARR